MASITTRLSVRSRNLFSNAIGAIGKVALDADLVETQYIIEIDNRLGSITDINGGIVNPSFIDDDNIAYYTVDAADGIVSQNTDDSNSTTQTINGPRGSILEFNIYIYIYIGRYIVITIYSYISLSIYIYMYIYRYMYMCTRMCMYANK